MDLFSDRYLYIPSKNKLEAKQNILWPVYVWKVLYPSDDQRLGTNLFQEAILALIRTGVRDPLELAKYLALNLELVRFIITTQLYPNGWIDSKFELTAEGIKILDDAEDGRQNLRVGYAFQDAISGAWIPRFVAELNEIEPISHDTKGHPEFVLDKEKGWLEKPFMLSPNVSASPDVKLLTEAYQVYQNDLARARHDDRSLDSGLQVRAIECLSNQATTMYLWCELYRDEGANQPWLISDPFRLRKAASWLRKPFLAIAPSNQALINKMQKLVNVPVDNCSAEEWLSRVEEDVDFSLWGEFGFLKGHTLILEHLGSVLRQKKKIEGRQKVNREDMATLLGEAHNLIESVLKWFLLEWSIDTRSLPTQRVWSRDEAKFEFNNMRLDCISEEVVIQLAGQSFKNIVKSIKYRDQPLKALLAGTLFCAAQREDHPFRRIDTAALRLDKLPALADFRNKVSGHASGAKTTLSEVLESTNFAIQWMSLFHDRY